MPYVKAVLGPLVVGGLVLYLMLSSSGTGVVPEAPESAERHPAVLGK